MGHVRCGVHGVLCCWACDRCYKCSPETGRLLKGEYCKDCTAKMKAQGYIWSEYSYDYVKPENMSKLERMSNKAGGLTA